MFERLFGPFMYFRWGMKYLAKLGSGFPRETALDRAMAYVKSSGIEGDYLEFGVFRGERFAAASYLSRKRGLSMRLLHWIAAESRERFERIQDVRSWCVRLQ
jgi:hypothetical protein